MCTAITYKTKQFYFGRTLDYEHSFQERVAITPRKYPLHFKYEADLLTHYAMIGMVSDLAEYPLYYEACNEKGLCMAGLNFVGYAKYQKKKAGMKNICQFEFIPYILATCKSVKEAKALLKDINITDDSFQMNFPVAELHYILADKEECITIEPLADGVRIYDNPVGVLTNNPSFDMQLLNLNTYPMLSKQEPKRSNSVPFYSKGMGSLGLPGDYTSLSRFVRVEFVKRSSVSLEDEGHSVNQFFHILGAIEVPKGCCEMGKGLYEYTRYTSCINAEEGIYYYRTYENHQITGIHMHQIDLDSKDIVRYTLQEQEQIYYQK